jgi:hypothetical protein
MCTFAQDRARVNEAGAAENPDDHWRVESDGVGELILRLEDVPLAVEFRGGGPGVTVRR